MQSITCADILNLPAPVSTQSCCLGKLHSRSLNTILAQGWLKCHLVVCHSFVAWITSLPPRMISFATSSVYLIPHVSSRANRGLILTGVRIGYFWSGGSVFFWFMGCVFLRPQILFHASPRSQIWTPLLVPFYLNLNMLTPIWVLDLDPVFFGKVTFL